MAPDPSRHAGQFRGGTGGGRGHRRRASWPHHPWLPGPLFRPQRGRARPRGRSLPAHRHGEVRDPAGACRPQGLRAATLAGRRRAGSGGRSLADAGALRAAVRGELACAARNRDRRDGAHPRLFRQRREARRAHRLRGDRAAFRAWLSDARILLGRIEQAQRCLWRLAGKPHALSARDCAGGARCGAARDRARCSHHRERLARWRHHHRRCGRAGEGTQGRRSRLSLRLVRRSHRRRAQPGPARLQHRIVRAHPQRRRYSGAGGGPDRRAASGREDCRRRQGRHGGARPRHARRPALGLACGGGARRRRRARAAIPARRPEAVAGQVCPVRVVLSESDLSKPVLPKA